MSEIAMPKKIELWKIEKLKPYDRNPRTHSDEQINKIAASIAEFGFTNPILVDSDKGIIAGHGRLEAAKKLGMCKVPVIELSQLTDAQKRAYIIADNRLGLDAEWDYELLFEELETLQVDDFNLSVIGFEEKELEAFLEHTEGERITKNNEKEIEENIKTQHKCPRCNYEW